MVPRLAGHRGPALSGKLTAEALLPEFTRYARAVLDNARALADALVSRGYRVITGGTDTPIVLVDLEAQGVSGDAAEKALDEASDSI